MSIYDSRIIKKMRRLDDYKALVTRVHGMIVKILHKEQGQAAADKYTAMCKRFDAYADKHGKPPTESKNTKNTKPKQGKNVIYIYDNEGNLINSFSNVYKCSLYVLGKRQGVKTHYIGKIYKGYLLSYDKLTQDEAREICRSAEVINGRGKYKREKR